jgi:hypothetical protein
MATVLTTDRESRWGSAAVSRRWLRERLFFTALPILMAAAVFVGFAPTYYLKTSYGTPPLTWLYHVHGFLFSLWMVLLIVQPALVASRRTDIHRTIGAAGAVLAGAMGLMAFAVSLDLGRRGAAPPGVPPLSFLAVPLSTVVVFPALTGAAVVWRRRPETHKRLMLIATLELLPAGLARWPSIAPLGPLGYFGFADVFLAAIALFDLATRGRVHPATIWGGLFLVASQVLRIVVSGTEAWVGFAAWLVR